MPTVFVLVLVVLGVLGCALWMVLNRPVARRGDANDRASTRLLVASVLVLVISLGYGIGHLF